jgi:hypothetical protein
MVSEPFHRTFWSISDTEFVVRDSRFGLGKTIRVPTGQIAPVQISRGRVPFWFDRFIPNYYDTAEEKSRNFRLPLLKHDFSKHYEFTNLYQEEAEFFSEQINSRLNLNACDLGKTR